MRCSFLLLVCTLFAACQAPKATSEVEPPVNGLEGSSVDGGELPDAGDAPYDGGGGIYESADGGSSSGDGGCGLACVPLALGCGPVEVCGDGTDNNCDGQVDEGCLCAPGAVQRCFVGPPGKRHIGACVDGQQTCQGGGEFGYWGLCEGGIGPKAEVCNQLDDDCNGCADESLCCLPGLGTCPGPSDPRIPKGTPFAEVIVKGSDFFPGALKYIWTVTSQSPCDQMLQATSGRVSYNLHSSPQAPELRFMPTLSGDYLIHLMAKRPDGTYLECDFVVPVRAPGLRTELCWDTTGQDDLDLWLHKPNDTTAWPGVGASSGACFFGNCAESSLGPKVDWGYPTLATGVCPSHVDCRSPRLDIDNVDLPGLPENINVDAPRNAESFRIAVNFYAHKSSGKAHPMVNVFCGGALRATYGGVVLAGNIYGAAAVTNFDTGGLNDTGSVWRVADVKMTEPADSCLVSPLHPSGTHAGYCVTTEPSHTFSGACNP